MGKIVIGAKTSALFSPSFALSSVILTPKIHTNHIIYGMEGQKKKGTMRRAQWNMVERWCGTDASDQCCQIFFSSKSSLNLLKEYI